MASTAGDVVSVRTAENVSLDLPLAGLGSRLLAQLLDLLIVAAFNIVLFILLAAVATALDASDTALAVLAASVASLDAFLYFAINEGWRGGRTPGKRALGLRVVGAGGGAIGFSEALVRNLVRAVDMLLGIGAVVMFFDSRSRRLGDFAAGTLVIRERFSNAGGLAGPVAPPPVLLRWGQPGAPLPGLERLGRHEHGVLRGFLSRYDLHPAQRTRIAADMAFRLLDRMGASPAAPERSEAPEYLIERTYLQLEARLQQR
jgi:uncharacterized RDD family membrane protein YckC